MLSLSTETELPYELKKLNQKYNTITKKIIPKLSKSLKTKGKQRTIHEYVKTKGELLRAHQRRTNVLKEIKNIIPHFLAAVMIKSNCRFFCIERIFIDPRGKTGALAKAIYSMPDEQEIFIKATHLASKILGYQVILQQVNPEGTNKYHNKCGGYLNRTNLNYDFAPCMKCGKIVNTHINAAKNIKDKAMEIVQSCSSPFPHTRVKEKKSFKHF